MRRLVMVLAFLALLIFSVLPASAQTSSYVVQPGDSLTGIAARFGVTIDALAAANNLTVTTRLVVGQQLVIPVAGLPSNTGTYTVQRGDTLSSIARRFNTTIDVLTRLNGVANVNRIFVGQALRVPSVQPPPPPVVPGTYVVQPGDNLFRIGLRFGVSPFAIAQANGIYNLNLIYAGQVLRIPR